MMHKRRHLGGMGLAASLRRRVAEKVGGVSIARTAAASNTQC